MEQIKNKSIRVIMLASGDLWAGAEAVVYQLARGLNTYTQIDVSVVLLNSGYLYKICKDDGIRTFVLDEVKYNYLFLIQMVINLIREIKPHIIHTHRYKENILAGIAAINIGSPFLVTTVHGMPELRISMKSRFVSAINNMFLKRTFSRVVAVSQDLSHDLKEKDNMPSLKIAQIYNGIEIDFDYKSIKENSGIINIGSAGRIVPVKDYGFMLDIAMEVLKSRNNIRFLLAGDGPDLPHIRKKVHELRLENKIILYGHVNDMRKFMSSLDIYINTSRHEGIPMTILDAMSFRLPIIAPHVGGIPEIINDGINGMLVHQRDVRSFVEVINTVLNRDELRIRLGNNAFETVRQKFSSEVMTKAYYNLYQDIISERS